MGTQDNERKIRVLSGEEISFKRKALMRRLDQVTLDVYKEFGPEGILYMHNLNLSLMNRMYNPEGGC